uniref:Uncharacterized protein n=1 Tax=Aureoumbra lagunensis TaxID=44058 RepID=A0A7S3JQF3_9STRA
MEDEAMLHEKERMGLDWRQHIKRQKKNEKLNQLLLKPPDIDDGEYIGERTEIQRQNDQIADAEEAALAAEAARAALEAAALEIKWWQYVLEFNTERLEACLQAGYDRIDLAMPENITQKLKSAFSEKHSSGSHRNNPLHLAVRFGYVEMVEILLKYGADPNAENGLGDCPILLAWLFWNPAHAQQRDNLRQPEIQAQALNNENSTLRILKALLEHGARPNSPRSDMSTALHEAARRGPVQAVQLLLKYGADHLQCDTTDQSPIDIAFDALKRQRINIAKIQNQQDDQVDIDFFTMNNKKFAIQLAQEKALNLQEIFCLLQNWTTIREEKRHDEFFRQWQKWLDQDPQKRSLRLGDDKPIKNIMEDIQLELSRRALTLTMLQRDNNGQPFWTYDAVRRSICCPKPSEEIAAVKQVEHFLENPTTSIAPAQTPAILPTTGMPMPEKELKKRRRDSLELAQKRRFSQQKFGGNYILSSMSKAHRDRPASNIQKLAVGLDRYLLRQVTARHAGFVETLDMKNIAKTDKDILLLKIKERTAAKKLQERKAASTLAKTKTQHDTNDIIRRGRLAAADRVLADAYRSSEHQATRRSVFRAATTKSCTVPVINDIHTDLTELRLYNQISTEHKRIQAHNPLQLARAQLERQQNSLATHIGIPISLELGAQNRQRVQSETNKMNELIHLPPRHNPTSPCRENQRHQQDDASSFTDASLLSSNIQQHKNKSMNKKIYPWEFRPHNQHDEPRLDYNGRLQKPHDKDINSMIEFAGDIGQRPKVTPLLLNY